MLKFVVVCNGKLVETDEQPVDNLSFVSRTIECAGRGYAQRVALQRQMKREDVDTVVTATSAKTKTAEKDDTLSEGLDEFSLSAEDYRYVCSLTAKNSKNQDHYLVLGLKNKRLHATEKDIKKAYREKMLRYHPDKNQKSVESTDFITCINRAFETLMDPVKRRAFDSVDPLIDDSLPTSNEIKNARDPFSFFSGYFAKNACWSVRKNVPSFGDENSTREEVDDFYRFWYSFESWRDFSNLDEEDRESGQDRDERRWIDKQNKAARQKHKKEEMARIRTLVDLAYKNDSRIPKFKEMEKAEKAAAKKARMQANQRRKQENQQHYYQTSANNGGELRRENGSDVIVDKMQKCALNDKKKAEAEAAAAAAEKAAREKHDREQEKKQLKMERKAFRELLRNRDFFARNETERMKNMLLVEQMCEIFTIDELKRAGRNLVDPQRNNQAEFINLIRKVKNLPEIPIAAASSEASSSETVKSANTTSSSAASAATSLENTTSAQSTMIWDNENITLLVKAVKLFPAGTNNRWAVLADYMNQHSKSLAAANNQFTAKLVLEKTKDLQHMDFANTQLKAEINSRSFENSSKKSANGIVPNGDVETSDLHSENGHCATATATATATVLTSNWTIEEQKLLEQALKTYPATAANRWGYVAKAVQTRSKKECIQRYKELVETIKAKKASKH